MRRAFGLKPSLVAVVGSVLVVGVVRSTPVAPEKLPEPVASTFQAMFPNAQIDKLDAEEENGVMVYDFEFRAGTREKETDIAADGTMLESTLVITAADVPPAAMKGIRGAARGARLGRLEWIETSYELTEGKIVKLPRPVIHYAAELARANQKAEVIVAPDGTVSERPEWISATESKPKAAGKTAK